MPCDPGEDGIAVAETVVSSATREVVIGYRPAVRDHRRAHQPDRPEEARRGDEGGRLHDRDRRDAGARSEAGAHMLDVNAGIPLADEPAILAETVRLVQSLTDVPLSIDSSIVAALEAGLAVYEGKPLVNSVTGEDERSSRCCRSSRSTAPRSSRSRTTRPASARTPTCGSRSPRRSCARPPTTASRPHDIVVDPLVMPIGAMGTAGRQVFALVRRLHDELGVNTTCGASNVSFGLPNRNGLNGAFLAMAIANGMTSAITSPAARGGAPGGDGRRRADGHRPRTRRRGSRAVPREAAQRGRLGDRTSPRRPSGSPHRPGV